MARHGREFWAELVQECDAGWSTADVAARHGVEASTLSWWRWKLRAEGRRGRARRRGHEMQLLPVEVAISDSVAAPPLRVEALVGGVVLRFEVGTDAEYIAALVRGIAPC